MKYQIEINCSGSAFGDGSDHEVNERDNEVARILHEAAISIRCGHFYGARNVLPLRDINGNTVGQIYLDRKD